MIWVLVLVGGIVWGIVDIADRADRRHQRGFHTPTKTQARPVRTAAGKAYMLEQQPAEQHPWDPPVSSKFCDVCGQVFSVGFWPGDYTWQNMEIAYSTHVASHRN